MTNSSLQFLVIGPSPPPYNGMSVATELVLKAMGNEIPVVHLDTADRRGLANIGKLEPGNIFLALYHGLKYLWILLAKRPRLVYVPVSQASLPFLRDCLFLIPARLLGKARVVHLHGGYFGTFYRLTSPLMRQIVRFALGGTDRAIVLGRSVENAFDGMVPAARLSVVPNGIPDMFQGSAPTVRNNFRPTLLFLSTLMAEKGTLDLLGALPSVRDRAGNVRAIFAGEWFRRAEKQAAERLVEKCRLGANVEFMGPVGPGQKHELLKSADMLILPSKNEGQPYVILEAMAAGLPIVSTNVGCIPEMVRDGLNGFLIEPGDIEMLAEKICMLLTDDTLRLKMGQASRKRFLSEFTFDKFAQRMRAVFREIVEEWQQEHAAIRT